MSNSLNLSIVEGRVVQDAQLLYTQNGSALCKFDIAVNEQYKAGDEYKTVTSFIPVNIWGKYGEAVSQHLSKGTPVRITGSIKQNSWEDKDGQKHSILYICAENLSYLGRDDRKSETKENA